MVWHIGDDRDDVVGSQVNNRLLATLRMTPEKLHELSHGTITSDTTLSSASQSESLLPSPSSKEYKDDQKITRMGGLSIHCNPITNCPVMKNGSGLLLTPGRRTRLKEERLSPRIVTRLLSREREFSRILQLDVIFYFVH